MGLVSVQTFRDYGPAGSFVDVDDGVILWHLDAAERTVASYIGKHGYEALTAADSDFTLAIFKMTTWDLLVGVRGVNPADAGHMAAKMARDEAVAWLKDVQKGYANISGATPARSATGTARVFVTAQSDGSNTRGW